ncbi:hypothetical protein SALBM217S_01008 [Streptomyces griseoloalbus]
MARHLPARGQVRTRPVSSVTGVKLAAWRRAANLALRLRVTTNPMPRIAMRASQMIAAITKSSEVPPSR